MISLNFTMQVGSLFLYYRFPVDNPEETPFDSIQFSDYKMNSRSGELSSVTVYMYVYPQDLVSISTFMHTAFKMWHCLRLICCYM